LNRVLSVALKGGLCALAHGAKLGRGYRVDLTFLAEWNPKMLYTLAVVLIVLWLLGLVTSTFMGGFIHVLLVIAIVVVLLRIISGRRPL
jgi:hypothetical protein